MRTILLIILTFLTSIVSFGKPTYSPYQFPAIDFNNLLPFSAEEISLIKKNKIKVAEIIEGNIINLHNFNGEGQLVLSERYELTRKKKKELISRTNLKYDNAGRLIHRNEIGVWYDSSDSISYDSIGRVIYFHSYVDMHEGKKKGKQKFIESKFQLKINSDNYVTLVDSTEKNKVFYTLNNQNRVIKVSSDFRSDSISTSKYNTGDFIKEFWVKHNTDSVYHLGKKIMHKENKIHHIKVYSNHTKGQSISYQTNLYYNENKQLIRLENKRGPNKVKTYIYSKTGLPLKIVNIGFDTVNIKSYQYKYH